MATTNITVLKADEGETLSIAGGKYRILVSGEQTNDQFAVIEMLVPPGAGPIPHEHPEMLETFYVAEGTIEFRTEAGKQVATAGGHVHIPLNGGVHAFKNISDQPARLLCTVMPAGLERMFREVSGLSPEEARGVVAKYKQKVYPVDYLG